MKAEKYAVLLMACVLLGVLIVTSSVQLRFVTADAAPTLEDRVRAWVTDQMRAQADVPIPMRDGLKLAANIYRPNRPGKFPVIMAFTGHSKDVFWGHRNQTPAYEPYQPTNTMATDILLGSTFEAVEPVFWVPYGYVVICVDARGHGRSPGTMIPPGFSTIGKLAEEAMLSQGLWARDMYDAIEWAGTQEWSNGNVGLDGVSILAFSQWRVAALNPPHLKAICPWEATTDFLREIAFRGGIPETKFGPTPHAPDPAWPPPPVENLPVPIQKGQDEFLAEITVPALICGTWSDHGIHTYGEFRAWRKISSEHKWLYTHGVEKWAQYYGADARAIRKMFFDHFLKGTDNRILKMPRVRLEVRDTVDKRIIRYEDEFPIARTQYKELYLDGTTGTLDFKKARDEGKVT